MRALRRPAAALSRRPEGAHSKPRTLSTAKDAAPRPAANRAVRGMRDLYGSDALLHDAIIASFRALATRFACEELVTPMLEETTVFARTLGAASDVVSKEMYTFAPPKRGADDGGGTLTLRPEGTAGVMRALISNGLLLQPRRIFYHGPMFRHERPQKGRLRQFHQVGLEFVSRRGGGGPGAVCRSSEVVSVEEDAEAIAAAHAFLGGVLGEAAVAAPSPGGGGAGSPRGVRLLINSLGDEESLRGYSAALAAFFAGHRGALSADSQARLDRGSPLRILDSKHPADALAIAAAPTTQEHMTRAAASRFERLLTLLRSLGIAYTIEPRLVRGLDYYRHTIFEFVLAAAPPTQLQGLVADAGAPGGQPQGLGQSGTLLAGGRYDGLCAAMGGPDGVTGIGWAAGVERLAAVTALQPQPPTQGLVVVVCSARGDGDVKARLSMLAMLVAHAARSSGTETSAGGDRSPCRAPVSVVRCSHMRKGLAAASAAGARLAVLLGEDELGARVLRVKRMGSGEQTDFPLDAEVLRACQSSVPGAGWARPDCDALAGAAAMAALRVTLRSVWALPD